MEYVKRRKRWRFYYLLGFVLGRGGAPPLTVLTPGVFRYKNGDSRGEHPLWNFGEKWWKWPVWGVFALFLPIFALFFEAYFSARPATPGVPGIQGHSPVLPGKTASGCGGSRDGAGDGSRDGDGDGDGDGNSDHLAVYIVFACAVGGRLWSIFLNSAASPLS